VLPGAKKKLHQEFKVHILPETSFPVPIFPLSKPLIGKQKNLHHPSFSKAYIFSVSCGEEFSVLCGSAKVQKLHVI
jgi:hypothetical protein